MTPGRRTPVVMQEQRIEHVPTGLLGLLKHETRTLATVPPVEGELCPIKADLVNEHRVRWVLDECDWARSMAQVIAPKL